MQVKFLKPDNWGSIIQVGQNFRSYFAFARKEGGVVKVLHPPILCRDFLLDGLIWSRDKTYYKSPVYGFPFIHGINTNEVELYVEYTQKPNLKLLHDLEDELGVRKTMVEELGPKQFYVNGDPWWNRTCLHLSSYSLILRGIFAGMTNWETLSTHLCPSHVDGKQLKDAIIRLKGTGYDKLTIASKNDYCEDIHEKSGIFTYFLSQKYEKLYDYGVMNVNNF